MGQVVVHPAAGMRPPERLAHSHDLSGFASREPQLDDWLKNSALRNEGRHARTFVICAPDTVEVIGFYAIANGAVQRDVAIGKLRRNAPDPIPVMVLGRLAIADAWQGRKLGRALLRDAVLRTQQASEIAGIAAVLVHAKNEAAAAFYRRFGFVPSEIEPMTLMLPLGAVSKVLG